MGAVLLAAPVLQALAITTDELWFHRRRSLPPWERLGHPLDTLTAAACYGWLAATQPGDAHALTVYVGLAALSCLFITKDEFVHARCCPPAELWLHAVLFVLHPVVFFCFAELWLKPDTEWILRGELTATLAFAVYQFVFWSVPWLRTQKLFAR